MRIALILIVIYLVLFYLKLDKEDCNGLYYTFKRGNEVIPGMFEPNYLIKQIIKIGQTPFRHRGYFLEVSEGTHYNAYAFIKYPKLTAKMDCKHYWAEVFRAANINHPKTIAYNDGYGLKILNNINDSQHYIIKPNRGGLGIGVKRVTGKQAKKLSLSSNNLIIQEYLQDCIKKARHYRFVSLYNGKKFRLSLIQHPDQGSIVSNSSAGGLIKKCEINRCQYNSDTENKILRDTMAQLCKLHRQKYPVIFSIGWDIMFNCKNGKNSKAYVLEGNVMHGTWSSINPDLQVMADYKRKYKHFMNIAR